MQTGTEDKLTIIKTATNPGQVDFDARRRKRLSLIVRIRLFMAVGPHPGHVVTDESLLTELARVWTSGCFAMMDTEYAGMNGGGGDTNAIAEIDLAVLNHH